jgi:hypothetical protein
MPAAPLFEPKPYKADVWRLVEAQHRVSTLKITDTLDEQALLESMIESTKPSLPPECDGLDYLLAAPFRYGAVYPAGSRFRRAGRSAGVFYASEDVETAVAEVAFYRLLFYAESPGTPFPDAATDYSAFAARIRTENSIVISAPCFDTKALMHLSDYGRCQDLADEGRRQGVELIRYPSVRDPGKGVNAAVLTPAAFTVKRPVDWQSWRIRTGSNGVSALCDFPVIRLSFDRGAFAADMRLAGFDWERR